MRMSSSGYNLTEPRAHAARADFLVFVHPIIGQHRI